MCCSCNSRSQGSSDIGSDTVTSELGETESLHIKDERLSLGDNDLSDLLELSEQTQEDADPGCNVNIHQKVTPHSSTENGLKRRRFKETQIRRSSEEKRRMFSRKHILPGNLKHHGEKKIVVSNILNELDENDLFFLSMSRMMKKLPQVNQSKIRFEICKMISEAEIKTISISEYDSSFTTRINSFDI